MTNFNDIKVDTSTILIVNSIEDTLSYLLSTLPAHSCRIIKNEQKDEFLLAQANAAIKEAYIASNNKKYLILCGTTFRSEAQNSLLKALEEPPKNIVFIIVTTTKSTILPTIFSRMPHKYLKTSQTINSCELDLLRLDLKDIYSFLKQNQKISKGEAINLVESMLLKVKEQNIKLTQKELEMFSNSIKLIDLNSRPINVLTTLLLTLSNRKNRF
ncbi:DNA polymerase III subunit delta' [Malaciobacter halophilus]|uniref:DNA polymerase III subunit delta n=1 Tax=Malaciobacter halophilus TaxID=197482 RepID=A0A2N1J2E3_9BACT|nr:DNA polymerase III subunit delta' [Malaciobacter halophilus]AXH09759.1 DNA polymerase III, delta prime subunit [Malaciobacter halophilus]PKI80729.1 DNA polymerase III subunit delta' [Malaciobacter halophilus]